MTILVTGCCGFIGTNLCLFLLKNYDYNIIGIDNMIDNYNVDYKEENRKELIIYEKFKYYNVDIIDFKLSGEISVVIHLASVPGVRNSILNPLYYSRNNIDGFVHLLDECYKNKISKIIYASSSSVYGNNNNAPFIETDISGELQSSYACSKKCMEIYASYYNNVFNLNTIGLRFFTVYGERGRPDMAPYIFLKKIYNNEVITRYGDGNTFRDYTYIRDIIDGIYSIIVNDNIPSGIYNLGNTTPVCLNDFISYCEDVTGKKAIIKQDEIFIGDVSGTHSCNDKAKQCFNYNPTMNVKNGLEIMFEWMKKNGRL